MADKNGLSNLDKEILLDFGIFQLEAVLFNTEIARRFYENLPYYVELTSWGRELYGTIGKNLGEENPVSFIKLGGLAYTNQGNYFCIFFGQNPAWTVEEIGRIKDDSWKILLDKKVKNVQIRQK